MILRSLREQFVFKWDAEDAVKVIGAQKEC